MADSIDRTILLDLLRKWDSGVFDEAQLHIEAESLWDAGGDWPNYPKDDGRSIGIEVLSQLDAMNIGFIGREDIPAFRTFLETPAGEESAGWDTWDSYWVTIDFTEREKALGADGYYRHA